MRVLGVVMGFMLLCGNSFGMTNVIFKQDGSQATVLLLGMPGDVDPVGFFRALAVPAEDFNGKWSKKLTLRNHAFDADCVFSKMVADNGTCTLIFRATEDLISVSRSAGKARLWLSGAAARDFARLFVVRDDATLIFRSRDGRLNVTVARDGGEITHMVIDWSGRGMM